MKTKLFTIALVMLFATSLFAQTSTNFIFQPRFDATLTATANTAIRGNSLRGVPYATHKTNQTDTTRWLRLTSHDNLDTLAAAVVYSKVSTDTVQYAITYQWGINGIPLASGSLLTDTCNNYPACCAAQAGYVAKSKNLGFTRPPGANQLRVIIKQGTSTGSYLATPVKQYTAAILTRKPLK
jgi:hypothetical protein